MSDTQNEIRTSEAFLEKLNGENAEKYGVGIRLVVRARYTDQYEKIDLWLGEDMRKRILSMVEAEYRLRLRALRLKRAVELEYESKEKLVQAQKIREKT